MDKEQAFNVAVACVMTSNLDTHEKQAVIRMLREYEEKRTINELVQEAHEIARSKGWHEKPIDFGNQIANMHAELSEAFEVYRSGQAPDVTWYEKEINGRVVRQLEPVDETWKPCGIPSELADVVIRIFDTCAAFGIDLKVAIEEKMAYNRTRPHRHGGKIV